ncbi:MAG: hypothetical protein ACLFSQ_07685 [Candidatus Zixiibacteriota bacterium]
MTWSIAGSGGVSDGVEQVREGEPVSIPGGFGELSDLTIGQAITGNLREIEDPSNLGFWYKSIPALLAFSISDSIWELDTICAIETSTMSGRDRFVISNDGNFYLDLGIRYEGSDTADWAISSSPGYDRITIRAQFTGDDRAPSVYNSITDCLNDEIKWSDSEAFGDYGHNIPPGRSTKLWLQFLTPDFSSYWGENTITLTLHGQYHLP